MTASPYEVRMRNMLVNRSASALSLATSFAHLADAASESANSPRFWPEIRGTLNYLEALNTAAFRQGGMSWDAVASFYGVSKQSVHRRLSTKVDEVIEHSQKYVELHEDDVHVQSRLLARMAAVGGDDLLLVAERQAQVWNGRRRTPVWWWSERA